MLHDYIDLEYSTNQEECIEDHKLLRHSQCINKDYHVEEIVQDLGWFFHGYHCVLKQRYLANIYASSFAQRTPSQRHNAAHRQRARHSEHRSSSTYCGNCVGPTCLKHSPCMAWPQDRHHTSHEVSISNKRAITPTGRSGSSCIFSK